MFGPSPIRKSRTLSKIVLLAGTIGLGSTVLGWAIAYCGLTLNDVDMLCCVLVPDRFELFSMLLAKLWLCGCDCKAFLTSKLFVPTMLGVDLAVPISD